MAIIKGFLIIFAIMILSCAHSTSISEIDAPSVVNDSILDSATHIPPVVHDSLVYDFAPTEIGTTWKYSYYHFYGGFVFHVDDSYTLRINVASKQIRGNDTLVFLQIKEEGFWGPFLRMDTVTGMVVDDSTKIDREYTDTVIVSDDLISRAPGFTCKVFPFYKNHGIISDSLRKILIGKDTILAFEFGANPNSGWGEVPSFNSIFLQGIGLYSQLFIDCCMAAPTTSIRLLSFNDIPIQRDTIFNKDRY